MESASSSSRTRRRVAEAPAAEQGKLMSLPSDILDTILARLPFEQMVRTCCLSRAWRRRWESLANLHIWFSPGSAAAPDDRVLWRCAAPVLSFVARVRPNHFNRGAPWLRALASKRVAKLIFEFDDLEIDDLLVYYSALAPALYSCRELVHLELHGYCHMPRAPRGFEGFPNLATLVLHHVNFTFSGGGARLEHLISSVPYLTELSLDDVSATSFNSNTVADTWAIRAPNLRFLKLIMFSDNGCRVAEELPLLEKAVISIDGLLETPEFLNTFRRIADVKELWFHTDSKQWNENPLEEISWTFQNLRVATLSINFAKLQSIVLIFSLLKCAPHIEKLEIEAEKTKSQADEVEEDFLNQETNDGQSDEDEIDDEIDGFLNAETSDDLFASLNSLKHISLNGVKYFANDMYFMKFLLTKTGSLESFVVAFAYERNFGPLLVAPACAELTTWRKASPKAKVSVSLRNKPTPNPDDS